jgi:pancreatic triacylglycerol lipase
MKLLTAFALFFAAVSASPLDESFSRGDGWYVPQTDGTFQWMTEADLQAFARENIPETRASPIVEYYLYTNDNPSTPQKIIPGDLNSLKNSRFNKANPTRVIIHGWQNDYLSDVNVYLRKALLDTGRYNVICVDWSDKAGTINYASSVLRVSGVGKQVAGLLDFLYSSGGMSFESLIVMGHSLGAHVSGYAGKNVKYGRIGQITGLDPALPLFSYDKPSERLNQNDAFYVESIQTNGGLLGFLEPIGKSSFYPNGGKSQPGCGIDVTGACAHGRSYEYYAEAIRMNSFQSMKCQNYLAAVDKNCGSTYSSIRMGSSSNRLAASGVFYVPVNKRSPYGMGA